MVSQVNVGTKNVLLTIILQYSNSQLIDNHPHCCSVIRPPSAR